MYAAAPPSGLSSYRGDINPSIRQVKHILLDCDNTLCLSERLAFEACADLANEILKKYGISDRYTTSSLLEDFVGQNFRGMMEGLQKKHDFVMSPDELDYYVGHEVEAVTNKLREKCTPCPNAPQALEWMKDQGYEMAVVSTSAKPRVVASLEKVEFGKYFPDEHVWSAATSLNPPSSKPDPAIYNHALKQLGLKPEETVTVEDSKSGATAAMRAGIPLIGYVGVYGLEDGREKMESMAKLLREQCGAKAIMYDWKEFPKCLKEIEAGAYDWRNRSDSLVHA